MRFPMRQDGTWYTALGVTFEDGEIEPNVLYGLPIEVPNEVEIDRIELDNVTPAAGVCKGRVGIYAQSNGVVGALLVEGASEVDFTETLPGADVSYTLPAGHYFLAVICGDASGENAALPTIKFLRSGQDVGAIGGALGGQSASHANAANGLAHYSYVYANLTGMPDPFSALTMHQLLNNWTPMIAFRTANP